MLHLSDFRVSVGIFIYSGVNQAFLKGLSYHAEV